MKLQKLLRQVHHWGSIVIALPLVVMIGAGILLMLKKDVEWIQPSSQKGIDREAIPVQTIEQIFQIAKTVEGHDFTTWANLDRFDVKPGKGIAKVISDSGFEVQVDTQTGQVLSVAHRQSDLIEAIHDGSFFANWVKYYLFLPSGIGLFLLWLTGLYLFFLPHVKNWQKAKPKKVRQS